ncbi:MAG TPA: GNAT family N-acetyltransferase [Candidatus Scatovivens faecipullorum]|nr:GNAT family N-acetyltransferase [Candidatus Scatovivens faecipullorum]
MITIEYKENLDKTIYKIIDSEFNKYAINNNIICNYNSFNFIAKDNNKIVGIITGHSYYKEVYISDLIILKNYRNKKIGTKLVKKVEEYFKDKEFENINLTTYNFQAPEFYKKLGFKIEFIRENKITPKLTKYFFIKYF